MRRPGGLELVLLAAMAACGGGQSSDVPADIQIAAGRDIQIVAAEDTVAREAVVFWRVLDFVQIEVWLSRLDGSEPEFLSSNAEEAWFLRDSGGVPRTVVVSAPTSLSLFPLEGRSRIDIPTPGGVLGYLSPERCVLALKDASGVYRLRVGPCDDLQPLAPELAVFHLEDGGNDHIVVMGNGPGMSGTAIWDVAPDGTVALLVPAILGEVDVPPDTAPAVGSSRYVSALGPLVRQCWDGHCYLKYLRRVENGPDLPFVYSYDTGREIALPGSASSACLWQSKSPAANPRLILWESDDDSGSQLGRWNLETGKVSTCPLGGPVICSGLGTVWRSDGGAVMVWALASSLESHTVVPVGDGDCVTIGASGWSPSFSPDGKGIAWTQYPRWAEGGQVTDFWAADGLGRDQHLVASLPSFESFQPLSGDELLVTLSALDGSALTVLPTSGEVSEPRAVAGGTFGYQVALGGRKLLSGTARSAAENSGTLSIVDLDGGPKRDIASGVVWYMANKDAVLYTVRGRYPSARDGLWLRRLP